MKNIIKKRKVLLILSVITTILIVGILGTYAWYVWSTNDNQKTKIVTSVGVATVIYDDGADIIGEELIPVSDKSKGIVKEIRIRKSFDATANLTFNLYLDINTLDEELKHESFKYELWSGANDYVVTKGDFSLSNLKKNLVTCSKNNTSHIVLLNQRTIWGTTSDDVYTLYIWIDGKNYNNPIEMLGNNFDFTLHADGENAVGIDSISPGLNNITSGSFAYDIVSLYNNSGKTYASNDNVRYSFDKAHNLMVDIDGNLRYYGKNPNNYVYFNCNDYTNQNASTCEKWRVIGLFDGKIKIVRDELIGSFSWDYTSDGLTDNNWYDATLNSLLNNGYYNNLDNISYYNNSTEPIIINFSSDNTGIKNDYTRSLIAENTWYLAGENSSNYYSHDMYLTERQGSVGANDSDTWKGKIALMYPSDFGYASDLSVCDKNLANYNDSENCVGTNWLFKKGYNQRLITPNGYYTNAVKMINSSGYIHNNPTENVYDIRPTLYLDEDVVSYSGDGSSGSPYKLIKKEDYNITPLEYGNAVTAISNYYMNNTKKVVTNNNVEYNYATFVNLMDDNNGNIRYYGAVPNNYVDIGDRDGSGNVILYRIVGVFDGNNIGTSSDVIKVVRNEPIGSFSFWNESYSGPYSGSSLADILNPGGLWWESTTGICNYGYNEGAKPCDFTSSGLSSAVHNKIVSALWNDYFGHTFSGKVALVSTEDYRYSTDMSIPLEYDDIYGTISEEENTWIDRIDVGWLLDCNIIYDGYYECCLAMSHGVYDPFIQSYSAAPINPSFFLNSDLNILSGNGTKTNPYVIG